MEPTANALHAGCLGNVNATWTFTGTSGHSARPWLADNAIHRAARGIAALADVPSPRSTTSTGSCSPRPSSVTRVAGGIARNVIPDRAVAHVNYRYAPGRSPADAETRLRELCEPHGSSRSTLNAPVRPRPVGQPAGRAAARRRRPGARAQAGVDAGRRVRLAGIDAVNFGPGDPAFAHRRDEQRPVAALAARLRGAGALRVRLSPVLTGMAAYPFVRLGEARRAAEARGVDVIDFGIGEPREETPAFIRQALAAAVEAEPISTYPVGRRPARDARRDRGVGAAALRRDAGPRHRGRPHAGLQGGRLRPCRRSSAGRARWSRSRRPATPSPSAGRCSPERASSSVPLLADRGWLPDLDALDLGDCPHDLALLWLNYPNNPTGARAPLELLERAAALARDPRVRPGLRRGLLGAVVRRRPAALRRCELADRTQRPGPQHALQALVDARVPRRLRRRRPRADRRVQALPAQRRASRRQDVRPARGRGRLGRRGARRGGPRALSGQARRRSCPRCWPPACA